MSLHLLPTTSAAAEASSFTLIVIATDKVPANLVGRIVDGVLELRATAALNQQMWCIEQAIRSITDREFTADKPGLSAVTS